MKHLAPYQLFFPIGVLNAFLAIGVWFMQDLNWFSSLVGVPAMLIHSKLIMGGFIWSFITGFLMTALPRMTGTKSVTKAEYSLALFFIFSLMISSWFISSKAFYTLHMGLTFFIIVFAARRILNTQKPIPVFFSHVILALITTLIGAYFYFHNNTLMGLHLYHVGPVLLLVLGIGTRFFSFLSGLPSEFESETSKIKLMLFHASGFLMVLFLYLAGRGKTWAYLALGFLALFYLFQIWKILRPSQRPSPLKWSVRLVALSIPLSFFLCWYKPIMLVTWFHLLFIGCFSIITFSVATRVILAHGSYPLDSEIRSRTLWATLVFLLLGLLFRISYSFVFDPMWKKSFLHLAATFWILALIVWGKNYFVKIFKEGPQTKPSC